ncbi:hypothetical protein O9G_005229 [Rozella allomycis CSF55]|uniref:Uncharacterized protein n=1 Tax=Rozella allomycis (strain CSF55) TaxID=988480 RepID=A0A075AYX2_ROZAC|nr:hypothetical protein O9G_005229 [Rozella allomycis CSF55]|eukprot:EPZ35467.1 hypothetical protein O9G_005229 [Rozella allomycis CSF55]
MHDDIRKFVMLRKPHLRFMGPTGELLFGGPDDIDLEELEFWNNLSDEERELRFLIEEYEKENNLENDFGRILGKGKSAKSSEEFHEAKLSLDSYVNEI